MRFFVSNKSVNKYSKISATPNFIPCQKLEVFEFALMRSGPQNVLNFFYELQGTYDQNTYIYTRNHILNYFYCVSKIFRRNIVENIVENEILYHCGFLSDAAVYSCFFFKFLNQRDFGIKNSRERLTVVYHSIRIFRRDRIVNLHLY